MKVEERRRLTDLFARGEELVIEDKEKGESVTVWVKKLSPTDAEKAIAKASAARARIWSLKKEDPSSDEYHALRGQVDELNEDQLVTWAVSSDMASRRPVIEAQVAFEKDWMKDRYLDGLFELLADPDFQKREQETPEDVEVIRVKGELQKYQDQCDEVVATNLEMMQDKYATWDRESLLDYVFTELLKIQADLTWSIEYEKCMVWLSVFDNVNRSERLFDSRSQVDELQGPTLAYIISALDHLNVGEMEGKDSQPTPIL